MSNQYKLLRAVGPQRHISSSKVALYTQMVAELKFLHYIAAKLPYNSVHRPFVYCSSLLNDEVHWAA